jgi:hypothetical protein
MPVQGLQVECKNCKVAATCPRKGSSPLLLPPANKRKVFCVVVGGYGRSPVEERILGPESRERWKKDGPCLTVAHVPTWDPDAQQVLFEVTKIFSQPVKHPRETVPFNINLIHPANPNAAKLGRRGT